MSTCAIRSEGLTRDFSSTRALDGVSIEVPAGSIFGFLGPNGAGKTTMIRILLGLIEPTAGSATVLGYDTRADGAKIRERSGALLEHSGIYERLTAEDNLEFYGRLWEVPARQRRARIRELLDHFGLWERRADRAGSWSRGMKQKLALARALFHRPSLVFLDEPTAGLDPEARASFREDLVMLSKREGATVFLTTHDLAEAEKVCDHVGIIRGGTLLAAGTLAELRNLGRGSRIVVQCRGIGEETITAIERLPEVSGARLDAGALSVELTRANDPTPVVAAIVGAGGVVDRVTEQGASLEDVYLSLMRDTQV